MAAMEDHDYLKVCAQIANRLSISLSSARRKVELSAAKAGVKDPAGRKLIAQNLLKKISLDNSRSNASDLDQLLTILAEDENFMIED